MPMDHTKIYLGVNWSEWDEKNYHLAFAFYKKEDDVPAEDELITIICEKKIRNPQEVDVVVTASSFHVFVEAPEETDDFASKLEGSRIFTYPILL